MNSRWNTNPIKRAGAVVSTRPNTPGDLEILASGLAAYLMLVFVVIAGPCVVVHFITEHVLKGHHDTAAVLTNQSEHQPRTR